MRKAIDHRNSEAGQALAMVVALVALIITASAISVIALAGSVTSARISSNEEIARASAVGAARIFSAALDSTTFFPPPGTATVATNVYPKGLTVTPAKWYEMGPSGLTSCTETTKALEIPCIRITDRVQKLSYTAPGSNGTTALASPYAINLQVTVRSSCLKPGNPPVGCQLNRLEERIAPRMFTDYVEFDNSELLDPLLVVQGYPSISYTSWYQHCTNAGVVKSDVTSSIIQGSGTSLTAGPYAHTCLVPAYLGPDAYSHAPGTTSGDVLNGPIGTNDATIFVCGHGSTQPKFDERPVASGTLPRHIGATAEYPLPAGGGTRCTGTPPAGKIEGKTVLPHSDFIYKTIATPADTYTSSTYIALCGTLSTNTYAATGHRGHGGPEVTCSRHTQKPWPATGVIYVNGTAYVSGTICQSGVTIAATGNIVIVNDLINERLDGYTTCAGSIGLVANRAVVITPGETGEHCPKTGIGPCSGNPSGKTPRILCWQNSLGLPGCQIVEAAVMALGDNTGHTKVPAPATRALLGGSFYERGWGSLLPPETVAKKTTGTLSCGSGVSCIMQFIGSITENFRGAFASYTETTKGPVLATGIAKSITFDPVLATQQPPYFLHPLAGIWQQEGLTYTGALQP